jgi:hypothetical protein
MIFSTSSRSRVTLAPNTRRLGMGDALALHHVGDQRQRRVAQGQLAGQDRLGVKPRVAGLPRDRGPGTGQPA